MIFILLFSLLDLVASVDCGTGVTYEIEDTGILTFSGSGTADCTIESPTTTITTVVFNEGVNGYSDQIFDNLGQVPSLTISANFQFGESQTIDSINSLSTKPSSMNSESSEAAIR